MKKNEIGGLPVVEDTQVVGMITESDIFEVLVETLGVEEGGTRLTLELPQKPGILFEVTRVLRDYQVNILSLATFYDLEKPEYRYVVVRIETNQPDPILEDFSKVADISVKHVWVSPEGG